MFEDFQQQAIGTPFSDNKDQRDYLAEHRHRDGSTPGLTPRQSFAVALLVLIMTAAIGILLLLVNAKIVPPFMG